MEFVVIGGDAAGMSAASRARRLMPDCKITVLEKTLDVSYSACGMPYNIADPVREIDDLVVRQAVVFREKQKINLLTGRCATKIVPGENMVKIVTLTGKTTDIHYDKLLIATGASPIIPDTPGFDMEGVMGLKTLDDGRKIKSYIKEKNVKHATIVGMGYIALEMSEALRERGIDVAMIKPRPEFMPRMDRKIADVIKDTLISNQVALHPGHEIERIEQAGKTFKVVCADLTLETDMVLVAIGVEPNNQLAVDAGLKTGIKGAISVDGNLRTSNEDIYAAGDCADAIHVVTGRKTWIPLALRANRAGWAVADNIAGKNLALPGVAGTSVFKMFDLEVARTGLDFKDALDAGFNPAVVTIKSRSRAHAHPGASQIHVHMIADKASGKLLGVEMVGKEGVAHRINAPAVALHAGMTIDEFLQCDLAYAPPFSPVWDPMLTAANQLLKKL